MEASTYLVQRFIFNLWNVTHGPILLADLGERMFRRYCVYRLIHRLRYGHNGDHLHAYVQPKCVDVAVKSTFPIPDKKGGWFIAK